MVSVDKVFHTLLKCCATQRRLLMARNYLCVMCADMQHAAKKTFRLSKRQNEAGNQRAYGEKDVAHDRDCSMETDEPVPIRSRCSDNLLACLAMDQVRVIRLIRPLPHLISAREVNKERCTVICMYLCMYEMRERTKLNTCPGPA